MTTDYSEEPLAFGSAAGGSIRPSSIQRRFRLSEAVLRSLRTSGYPNPSSTMTTSSLAAGAPDADVAVLASAVYTPEV